MAAPRRTCFETQCITTLQGHPSSLILAPIDSAYGTSYWTSIVTLVLYLAPRFRAFVHRKPLFHTYPLFRPKFRGDSFVVDAWFVGICKQRTRQAKQTWNYFRKVFQPMWSPYLVTDSDRQIPCPSNTILCVASSGNIQKQRSDIMQRNVLARPGSTCW